MKVRATMRLGLAIQWTACIIPLLPGLMNVCEGGTPGSSVKIVERTAFRNNLEFTLKQGLIAKKNGSALRACRALMGSGDADLVACVTDAVLDTRNKRVCRQLLAMCLRSGRPGDDVALTGFLRMVAMNRLALGGQEYRSYLQINVDQLNSRDTMTRSLALSQLRTVQPCLRKAFAGTESIAAFPKKIRQRTADAAYCKEAQVEWERWLRTADPRRIHMGLAEWRNRLEDAGSVGRKEDPR